MDIRALSVILSQARAQQLAGIAVMKLALSPRKETAAQRIDEKCSLDPSLEM